MELVTTDVLHGQIALTGFYERPLTRRIVHLARRGGLMVDVGANAGYFALLWAAAHASNTALAIEAAPRNVALLRRNVERNGFAERVEIHGCAAGRAEGVERFDLGPPEETGWGGLVAEPEWEAIDVRVERLDDLVGERAVAFLKVDVEGADTWVLEGAERALRQKRVGEVHFEQNRPKMAAIGIGEGEAQAFLASVGYVAEPVSDPAHAVVDWMARPA